MKVEVIKNEEQEITYPCLMKTEEGLIVYFCGFREGVVLVSGLTKLAKGQYANDWYMDIFKPFTGKLVLSNE